MKIRCDGCRSVYVIDDSLISARGIKAQCPKCGHHKVVRTETTPPPEQSVAPPEQQSPSSGTSCFRCGAPMGENSDAIIPLCDNCRAGGEDGAGLPDHAAPLGAPGGGVDPTAELADYLPPPMSSVDGAAGDPLADLPPASAPDITPVAESSTLTPAGATERSEKAASDQPKVSLDPNWIKVRTASDQVLGPMSLQDVRALYSEGRITPEDMCQSRDGEWRTIAEVGELIAVLRRTPQLVRRSSRLPGRIDGGGASGLLWKILLVLVVLGAGGSFVALYLAKKNQKKVTVPTETPVDRLLSRLRGRFPDVKGGGKQSKALTVTGGEEFAKHTLAGYTAARTSFGKALLLNRHNLVALHGLVRSSVAAWKLSGTATRPPLKLYSTVIEWLVRKRGRHAGLFAALAAVLAADEEQAKGKEACEKALAINPKQSAALLLLGQLLLSTDPTRAAGYFERALKVAPDSILGKILLAKAYVALGRVRSAVTQVQKLAKAGHPGASFMMGEAMVRLGNYGSARFYYRRGIRKAPHQLQQRLRLAQLSYQGIRDLTGSRRLLRGLKRNSRAGLSLQKYVALHLGLIGLERGTRAGIRAAERNVEQALRLDPGFLPAHFARARVLASRGKAKRALQSLAKVMRNRSGSKWLRTMEGVFRERSGSRQRALSIYRQVISDHPRFVWPYFFLAASLIRQKDRDRAFAVLRKVVDLDPSSALWDRRLTDYYWSPRSLERVYATLRSVRVGDSSLRNSVLGIVAYHIGRRERASTLLKRALAGDPKNLGANLYLAQVLLDRGRYREALSRTRRAFRSDKHVVLRSVMAWALLRTKRYKAASRHFKGVVRARPRLVSARIGAALADHGLGKSKKALRRLKGLLATEPNNVLVLRALYKLKW